MGSAVIAPVFFRSVLGMIRHGRSVLVQQTLTTAFRVGAGRAVRDGGTTTYAENVENSYFARGNIDEPTIKVSPSPSSSAGLGDRVTVTVSIPPGDVSWLPTPMFLGGTTMTATSVMRRESVDEGLVPAVGAGTD